MIELCAFSEKLNGFIPILLNTTTMFICKCQSPKGIRIPLSSCFFRPLNTFHKVFVTIYLRICFPHLHEKTCIFCLGCRISVFSILRSFVHLLVFTDLTRSVLISVFRCLLHPVNGFFKISFRSKAT